MNDKEYHCDSCLDSGCHKCAYGQDKANAELSQELAAVQAAAQAREARLRDLLESCRNAFWQKTHPGEPCRDGRITQAVFEEIQEALSTPSPDWLAGVKAEERAKVCREIIIEIPSLNSMHRELIESKAKEAGK